MNMHHRIFRLTSVPLLIGLCACSGSSSEDVEITSPPVITEPPIINQAKVFDGPMSQAGEAKVTTFIKNGIFSATADSYGNGGVTPVPIEADVTSSDDQFSQTNTQEEGVDEADRIEYDGNTMYIATYAEWVDNTNIASKVRVMRRNDDYSMTQIDELALQSESANIDGIYLADDRLAVVSSDYPVYALSDVAIQPWEPTQSFVDISIFNTQNPADISNVVEMKIEGWLFSSRRIGDQLYLVSGFVPRVDSLTPFSSEDDVQLQNYLSILETPIESIMPSLRVDGVAEPLVLPENCLIPSQAQADDGYGQILTITRVNLQQPADRESLCLSAYANAMYMSQDSLYLAGGFDNKTGFHKFSLTDLSYQAFGSVDGQLGWRVQPNLRMDEEGDDLRVISTDYSQADPEHKLTILRQNGNTLEMISELPNSEHPEPIGKPNEDIFAVRFRGDMGYIVTFEQIDPLYVLDLSDSTQPLIAGELEIPGFSSYLHPLDNGYLIGVGQQVDALNIPQNGSIPTEPVVTTGMKVSLFDITDPSLPVEIGSFFKEQSYTPVQFDYKALTVLNLEGNYRFALPVEQWGVISNSDSIDVWSSMNSLVLLNVDTGSSEVALTKVGELAIEPVSDTYIYAGEDRSVIQGDHVYYLHGNSLWHGLWNAESQLSGPF